MKINSVTIRNFRSIENDLNVPLHGKTTFLVGANNTGKTNILRALAYLLNGTNTHLDKELDFRASSTPSVRYRVEANTQALLDVAKGRPHLSAILNDSVCTILTFNVDISPAGITCELDRTSLYNTIPEAYLSNSNGNFLEDFQSAGPLSHNLTILNEKLEYRNYFAGTVFLPSMRLISKPGHEIPHFGHHPTAGETLTFGKVVDELAVMSAPNGGVQQRKEMKNRFIQVCEFLRACLEVRSVAIQVPHDKTTLYVSIDGEEQPISNLGSGIEQLILIGVASFAFPKKLVLLDEPELHFHPRTQKLMMRHLQNQHDGCMVIATHSSAILDSVEADIVQVSNIRGACNGRVILNSHQRYEAIKDLGHSASELVQTNFAIWVEGPSDRIFINKWLSIVEPDLIEGVDYSIIFYGGAVLSQHAYEDTEEDLVRAVSICRQFAIYADSDRHARDDNLKGRVQRVASETKNMGGYCWISAGREIENYIPIKILSEICKNTEGIHIPIDEYDQILDTKRVRKVAFAKSAVKHSWDEWPLDLRERVDELVECIKRAR